MRMITRPSTAKCTMPLYISFLISEPHYPSACRLAKLMNISHDSVNRFILRESYTPKDLFDQAKQQLDLKEGVLSVDDSVLDKPYSHQMALVGHFWSGKHHRSVKGINLITLYYTDIKGHHLPVNYRIYNKLDHKTKNDYFLEMLDEVILWGLTPAFVTGDSWYSGTKNLKAIKNKGLSFMFALKSNRHVSLKKKEFMPVQSLDIPDDGQTVWLREFGFIKAFRTTLKNEHRHYALYLADETQLGNIKRLNFNEIHDKHWQIEQYHRAIKQVCHIEHSQVRAERGVRNHIFAALSGYVHLQKMCLSELIVNTYALHRDLFNSVISQFIEISSTTIKGLLPEFRPSYNA